MLLSVLLASVTGIKKIDSGKEHKDVEITFLSTDSKKKQTGGMFICLCGNNADGHQYAQEALANGAIAIVTERALSLPAHAIQIQVSDTRLALAQISAAFYRNPSKYMQVIALTGTNGKTTTSYLLASILEKAGKRVGVIGTLGVRYAGRYYPSDLTTPDPIYLQKTLAEMLACGIEYVVMEVSAHALYYKKTDGIYFTACIFTNFTQDHLDFFKTMEEYKRAKQRLFSLESCGKAILNGDEETGRAFARLRERGSVFECEKLLERRTVFYGLHTPADTFAVITDESLHGSECMLNLNDKLCRISLSLTGRHNVYNALAAATCAAELGISVSSIAEGLNAIKTVTGRLERIGSYNGGEIYVDFAHTPDGLSKCLDALRGYCKGRLICLFGCGGNRDKSKRPIMGETAAKKADFSVLTSDNPRYEDPLDIISAIERGHRRFSVKYVVVPDRKKAIFYAMDMLKTGDILLVAGKGGEEYQEIMGIKYEFNDKDTIKTVLEQKGETHSI